MSRCRQLTSIQFGDDRLAQHRTSISCDHAAWKQSEQSLRPMIPDVTLDVVKSSSHRTDRALFAHEPGRPCRLHRPPTHATPPALFRLPSSLLLLLLYHPPLAHLIMSSAEELKAAKRQISIKTGVVKRCVVHPLNLTEDDGERALRLALLAWHHLLPVAAPALFTDASPCARQIDERTQELPDRDRAAEGRRRSPRRKGGIRRMGRPELGSSRALPSSSLRGNATQNTRADGLPDPPLLLARARAEKGPRRLRAND